MNINELLKPWIDWSIPDGEVTGLHNDSREIRPGFLFFAYPGALADGRFYIHQALKAGALAVLCEADNWPKDCPKPEGGLIPLSGLTHHMPAIASRFYGDPSKKIKVTGVTGTNGKTTIAWQLAEAHERLSMSAAYVGTLGQGKADALKPLKNTTPDALCLQQLFHDYQKACVRQVCMEVSSIALDAHRVDNIDFEQGIFTNLTLDHLDYHHTMDAYAAAKAQLFARSSLKWAIINNDDAWAPFIKAATHVNCKRLTYGLSDGCDVRALRWDVTLEGTVIELDSPWGRHETEINALGFFNIYNALAVFASLMVCGYDLNDVIRVISKLKAPPGRMEVVAQRPYVIVDYAHTPDALENVLVTLNNVKKGRILLVFGCGGDRDKTKRAIMGEIASRLSDVAIITSDNPRTEDPRQIIREVESGRIAANKDCYCIIDRKAAIAKAIELAGENDIILVAGKGHEDYQQIGHERIAFYDQAVIKELMAAV